ncbi:TetR/AcrR family transcriptional regulator [Streptomyces sp. DT24]|uniref:TetR/AcrR family transcriptional regulator n=1 Tax=unclassified Streptomyces TaxID=2593676 RepID=UPI0023B9E0A6|nr:TetR/AcrR family transcriptional regulator [Streptomyces sp. AM 4-1-1]WEH35819.1 WHG domain-containing protein [Streptomyces sp. AM 4-1-1]
MARAGLTRDRVVEAAADLADAVGFDNVTVSALARGFGVKDASLYSHISNLRDLRTGVALLASSEFADRISAAVAGRAGKDALVAFADAYRAFVLERPGRYAATQFPVDPEVATASPAYARTLDVTYSMMRAYDLPEPDLTDAVRLLRSTFHGYSALEANGAFHDSRDVRASWERGVEALHVLLEHWPPARESAPPASRVPAPPARSTPVRRPMTRR